MSGRESGVVRNDRTNMEDIWRLNRSPQGQADVAGAWERGAKVKGTKRDRADSVSEGDGPTTRRRTHHSPAQAPPSQNSMRQGGSAPAQESALQNRLRQTEEKSVRLQTKNQELEEELNLLKTKIKYKQRDLKKLEEEAVKSASNSDKKNKELDKVFKIKENLKTENQKQKEELEKAQSEIEHLSEKMTGNTLKMEQAMNQLEDHLNKTKYMSKFGHVRKSAKGYFEFIDTYQRHVLCPWWYQRTEKSRIENIDLGDASTTPLLCEKLGACPFAHNIEERNIELKLSGEQKLRKSKVCKSANQKYPCCFTAEDCWFWHEEEDTARGVPFNDRANKYKRIDSAKSTPKENPIHFAKVAKKKQIRAQEKRVWIAEAMSRIEAREKKLDEDYPQGRKPYDKLSNRSPLYLQAVLKLVKAGRLSVSIEDLEGEPSITNEIAARQEAGPGIHRVPSIYIRSNYLSQNLNEVGERQKVAAPTPAASLIDYVVASTQSVEEEEPPRRSPRDHASRNHKGKYGGAASEPEAEGPSN
eukprot:SAG11_NODE_4860_length_1743_cov_9.509732_1_plen_528_part_00